MRDSPKVLEERIRKSPGVPLIWRSSGTVMSCSTSSAANPGTWVVTCAATSPSSGYASTERVSQEYTPKALSNTASRITATRLCRQKATNWSIIEQDPAFDDHLLPGADTGKNDRGGTLAQPHFE